LARTLLGSDLKNKARNEVLNRVMFKLRKLPWVSHVIAAAKFKEIFKKLEEGEIENLPNAFELIKEALEDLGIKADMSLIVDGKVVCPLSKD